MIFKTIWANRKQNGFVFAEIILITVLSFFIIDFSAVNIYDNYICRPSNDFERKHLLVGKMMEITSEVKDPLANVHAFRDYVSALPEVQSAGLVREFIGKDGITFGRCSISVEADSTRCCHASIQSFTLHNRFFETQGLTPIHGSPSAAVLSDECPKDGAVISRSMARALFGTDQVVGRRIVSWGNNYEKAGKNGVPVYEIMDRYTIAGVMEDFRINRFDRYCYSIIVPEEEWAEYRHFNPYLILIRLRPNADADAFVSKYAEQPLFSKRGDVGSGLHRESYQIGNLKTYADCLSQLPRHYSREDQFSGILLTLLLLNVMLGTLGTYWLQLRRRTEDIGIMRSFGARRRDIFFMVWSEAALLSFAACIIGQVICLQIALRTGLYEGVYNDGTGEEVNWVTQFWPHFFIIGTIQYLIILIIVTLGIVVPATHAMYKNPVDALRHE